MSSEFEKNAEFNLRRIKRVNHLEFEYENDKTMQSNILPKQASKQVSRPDLQVRQNVQVDFRNESETRQDLQPQVRDENLEVPGERVFFYGNHAEEKSMLVFKIEEKLCEVGCSGMIGVFGIDSDDAIADALNAVRVPYEFLGKINYYGNDVYRDIVPIIWSYMDDMNFEPRMSRIHGEILNELGREFSAYNEDNGIWGRRHELNEIISTTLSNIKTRLLGVRQRKFIVLIECQPGEFCYNLLQKLYNINSPDLVIILYSFADKWLEARHLAMSVGDDDIFGLFNRYFTFDDTFEFTDRYQLHNTISERMEEYGWS